MTNNKTPALLDFYADWCAPCKALTPTIDALTTKYEGKLEVKKVNVDEKPELAELYSVRSIPTLILLDSNGVEVGRKVGGVKLELLEKSVEELFEKERLAAG